MQISQFLCEIVCFCPPLHSFSLYLLFLFVHMMECSLPLDLLLHLTKELNQCFAGGCHRNNFWVLPSQNYWVSGRKSNGITQGIVIATMDFFSLFFLSWLAGHHLQSVYCCRGLACKNFKWFVTWNYSGFPNTSWGGTRISARQFILSQTFTLPELVSPSKHNYFAFIEYGDRQQAQLIRKVW